jgi:hypothetical protein
LFLVNDALVLKNKPVIVYFQTTRERMMSLVLPFSTLSYETKELI